MKTRAGVTVLAVGVGLFALACEGPPTGADGTTLDAPDIRANASHGPVVARASGNWTVPASAGFDRSVRSFTFTARQYADGTVEGEWERVNRGGATTPNHGDVVCLTIINNQAWIGTLAETGPFAGLEGGFRAVDNGEGANAPPDQMSFHFPDLGVGGAAAYCAGTPDNPPLETLGDPNVQIK